ncbi:MAG: hypothetical protein J6I55_08475 [Ruminococcus sp.]|nr:hypothetical protein [Ruminococcus sp.]
MINHIKDTTSDISEKPKEFLFSENNYCVFGYVCYVKYMIQYNDNLKGYEHDKFNRRIFGFFGFAVKKNNCERIPIPDIKICAESFKKYIIPVWNKKLSSTIFPDEIDIPEKIFVKDIPKAEYMYKEKYFYTDSSGLFDNALYMAVCNGEDISYCSNISDFDKLKKLHFDFVVTNSECIQRFKHEFDVKPVKAETEQNSIGKKETVASDLDNNATLSLNDETDDNNTEDIVKSIIGKTEQNENDVRSKKKSAERYHGLAETSTGRYHRLVETNYGLAETSAERYHGLAETNYGLAETSAERHYGLAETNYGLAETSAERYHRLAEKFISKVMIKDTGIVLSACIDAGCAIISKPKVIAIGAVAAAFGAGYALGCNVNETKAVKRRNKNAK